MPKKVTERSRGSREVKNIPKVRKVAKTGAERIREYRARIIALENASAAGHATNVEDMAIQTASQQKLEDNQVAMRENQRSLLYEALSRQSSQAEQEAGLTTLRRHSKTAKTPAERARAYRERKKFSRINKS